MLEELFKYGDTVTITDQYQWGMTPRWVLTIDNNRGSRWLEGDDLVKLISDMLLLLQPIELVVVEDEKV